jgi:hypothetical protein
MDAAERIMSDPSDSRWRGIGWSDRHALDKTGGGYGLVPQGMGIYRLRSADHPDLIYAGISCRRIRTRISNLRNGAGHYAAPCAAAHVSQGHVVEIS